jgi:DedD protein
VDQKLSAKPVEIQKTDLKLVHEAAKPAAPVDVSKAPTLNTKAKDEIKGQEIVAVPIAKPPEARTVTPVPEMAKLESHQPAAEPVPAPVKLTPGEAEKPAKPSDPAVALAASSNTEEVARPRADAVSPLPLVKDRSSRQTKPVEPTVTEEAVVAKSLEMKAGPAAPPAVAIAKTPVAAEPVVKALPPEPRKVPQAQSSAVAALRPSAEKASTAGAGEASEAATKPSTRNVADVPAAPPVPHKSPETAAARNPEATVPPLAKLPQDQPTESRQARSSVEQLPEPAVARKNETPAPAPGVAKTEPAETIKPETKRTIAAPIQEIAQEKPEQLALLRKPAEPSVERPAVTRPAVKPLEGFIIQIAFNDKEKAQTWAEKMQQRGYAVSVTQAGPEASLRVRLGNFAMRDEAERQLQNFKQEGMSGIIINLPQAFRPEARSSLP